MRAKGRVLEFLNNILTNELTAINQYFIHAEMCRNWGYEELYDKFRELSRAEMDDAQRLIGHILYLEGVPNMQRLGTVQVGENALEHLQLDQQLEQQAVAVFSEAITHCAQVSDYTTLHILERMVSEEESHINWLETQLAAISQVGLERYLSEKL